MTANYIWKIVNTPERNYDCVTYIMYTRTYHVSYYVHFGDVQSPN